jgi:hypothetical protein
MTAPSLSPGDRRALSTGAIAIMAFILIGAGVPRYLAWRTAAFTNAEQAASALARVRRSVVRYPRTTAALLQVRQRLALLDSLVLVDSSAATAGTSLADAISEAAEGAGVTLGSIQIKRDTLTRSRLRRIAARATVSGDVEAIALFLESLEGGTQLLAVREWSINGGSTTAASGQPELLRMDVLLEGIARPPQPLRKR